MKDGFNLGDNNMKMDNSDTGETMSDGPVDSNVDSQDNSNNDDYLTALADSLSDEEANKLCDLLMKRRQKGPKGMVMDMDSDNM